MQLRGLLFSLALAAPAPGADLFRDDFAHFPPRVFSEPVKQLTNAIQEYHYLAHRGVPLAPWANAICHTDSWAGGDEDGKPYVEQHEVNPLSRLMNPTAHRGRSGVVRLHARSGRPPALLRRDGRHRLSLPHQPALLSLRPHRREPLRLAASAPTREEVANRRVEGSRDRRIPLRHEALLHAEGGEPGAGDRGLHRRETADRGQRFGDPQRQDRHHLQHPRALCGCSRQRKPGHGARDRAANRRARGRTGPTAAGKSPAEAVEEVRNAGLRSGPQRALRRPGRRRPGGYADRAERPQSVQELVRPYQLPDGGEPRWQGALADRPARPLQRRAGQRHALPDPRHRRRREERGRPGEGLQDPDPGGRDRQGQKLGLDARGAQGQQGTAVRVGGRRFHLLRRFRRPQGAPGNRRQGPLPDLLGLRRLAETALVEPVQHRPFPLRPGRRRRRARGDGPRLFHVLARRQAAVEPGRSS